MAYTDVTAESAGLIAARREPDGTWAKALSLGSTHHALGEAIEQRLQMPCPTRVWPAVTAAVAGSSPTLTTSTRWPRLARTRRIMFVLPAPVGSMICRTAAASRWPAHASSGLGALVTDRCDELVGGT